MMLKIRIAWATHIEKLSKRSYNTINVENTRGVSIITLNRPKKKNAFSWEMYAELGDALNKASLATDIKVALLTANGDFYSSGNDLSNFSQLAHPLTMAKESKAKLSAIFCSLLDLKKPLVSAVNGPAIGIAVTSLGLCDYVVASNKATFHTPFAALGQAPEGCSSYTFPRIMGEERAHDILWKGLTFTAEDALKSKLIHAVVPPEQLLSTAIAYCEALVQLPSGSPEIIRAIVRQGLVEKLHQVNREELDVLEKKLVSKECFQALAKYLDSRKMHSSAFVLRAANATGFLWGQPKSSSS